MDIGYTDEQQAMRTELRSYYEKLLDEKTVKDLSTSHGIGETPRRVWKQMCADGWAGIGWPKDFGVVVLLNNSSSLMSRCALVPRFRC